jgi:hypothetical protein
MATGHGTSNFTRKAKKCNEARGVTEDSAAKSQQDLHGSISRYTAARHRRLIAMRCAHSSRPANQYRDRYYVEEVELLRPGTSIPDASTISRDINKLYQKGSIHVKEYFEVSFTARGVNIQKC